ncbi:MAG: hypothetical protein Fur002_02100 [Anaerolineales bacterium]
MDSEEKSQKRVEKLFSDLEQMASQPPQDGAARLPQPPPASLESAVNSEMDALISRVVELERQLGESQMRAVLAEAKLESAKAAPTPTPVQVYEKERVGFAYLGEKLLPVEAAALPEEELSQAEQTPLIAGGAQIGDIKIKAPQDRIWTDEERRLAQSVARQVSLQIQNMRLLSAAERARAEAQAATRRFAHESWQNFLDGIRNRERMGYQYNQAAVEPFNDAAPAEYDYRETVKALDEQVGSLFVKANPSRPLNEEDRAMVSAIARQVAQQVESLRLLADASRARAEAEEATRRLSRDQWQTYLQRTQTARGYLYDSVQVSPLTHAPQVENIRLTLPLKVRGENIGQILLSQSETFSPQEKELAEQVAVRVSEQLERLRLTEEIEKRAAELATVAQLSTATSTVLNPQELLQQVVDLAKERFNLYHAQIYLADESWNTLLLAASAGEVGKEMIHAGSVIPLNSTESLLARAAHERRALIAADVNAEEGFQFNPLLPDVRSEMAVPIIAADKVIGVFNLQANAASQFSEQDANIYATLAAQIGVSLQNARLYEEQSATVAQLRELDRLKSSFLANMSHELRTPLNSILGFADVILEELDGPLTDNMRNDLGLIYKNGQHLLHLINDVLDMAKIESGKMNLNPERFNLEEVLSEVVSITAPMASEKNLALFIEPDSEHDVEIYADKIRIRQVVINLVNNSIKFTEKGKIAIRVVREDKHVLLSVKDSGIGIPQDHLEAVFQEFTQVDTSTTRKVGGTGLGLPISRRLIEMHGGKLWAESSGVAGEGSTFYAFLPLEAKIEKEEQQKVK